MTAITGKLAIAVEKSKNSKTGDVSATYATQTSCPNTCPLLHKGCYAEVGFVGMITHKLNASDPNATPDMIAEVEAAAIDTLSGKRHLRLHVVGDCSIESAVSKVAAAAMRHMAKYGKIAWTYTHAWRIVARRFWGSVSVLASCESMQAVKKAHARGYAAAMVVESHPVDGKAFKVDGFTLIPCPQQTGKAADCLSCGLCFKDKWLHDTQKVILFAAHGLHEESTKEVVRELAAQV